MSLIITLFALGIILIGLEIVLPGAILGIAGGLLLLGGVIASFVQYGVSGGALASILAVVVGGITLYLEFVYLPKSRLIKALSISGTVTGSSRPEIADAAAVMGREVVAVTTLAPTGYVELDGRRYEAASQCGLVQSGARLRVVGVEPFRLLVNPLKTSS
jgi:membrane-bound ClpP family serine protease